MIGTFSKTTDSNIIEIIGKSGFDFIIIDKEHGPVTDQLMYDHVRSAKVSEMKSIIRVANNSPQLIGAALDTGADGILIPHVSSYQEAQNAIQGARYYPQGQRGVCRFVRAAEYGLMNKADYFSNSNKKLLILQIEGVSGVNNIDRILKLENFDGIFVGPYDLSQSLGIPGEVNDPKVLEIIKEVAIKSKDSGKLFGTFADSIDMVIKLKEMSCDLIAYSVDTAIILEAHISIINSISGK